MTELTDGVVTLNRYTLDDTEAHLAGEDEETARRFGWYPRTSTVDTVQATIRRWQEDGPVRAFAVRVDGDLVGGCEVRLQESPVKMSYWTACHSRGRGYASRALRLASDWALGLPGVTRIELCIEPDNRASRAVALRAGFREERFSPAHVCVGDEPRDMVIYGRERASDPQIAGY